MPDPVSSKKALNTAADVPHTHGTDNAETNSYHPGRGDEHDEIDVRSFLCRRRAKANSAGLANTVC